MHKRTGPLAFTLSLAASVATAGFVDDAGITGGLVVHVGCDRQAVTELTSAAASSEAFLIHVIDIDAKHVEAARQQIMAAGVYGRVSADTWDGARLPYASGSVNLLVAGGETQVARDEIERVLAPRGVWVSGPKSQSPDPMYRKPVPDDIDEWSHYLHEADNNAVAHDTRIGPPRSLQWIGSPRWARHHDRMASMSALVSAKGRIFYIFDEGSTASVVLPSRWALIARDAFNGVVLWKKAIPDWQTRLWPLKSGPAQLPRRLVTDGEEVYATLGINVPVTAIDAATGKTLRVYEQTRGAEEVMCAGGTVFAVVDPSLNTDKYVSATMVSKPWWTGKAIRVMAVEAKSGTTLWQHASSVVPLTLTIDDRRVLFHDGAKIICLDRATGRPQWTSDPIPIVSRVMSFFAPTMVAQDGVILFAGGEESGLVKSTGGATKSDTLTALDAGTGKTLWTSEHLPSGYSSPEDLFVCNGTVWYGGVSNGNLPGLFRGLELRTGKVKHEYESATVETYWFHHRCYRGKATDNYLMVSRTGIEFIDPKTGKWDINHWTRGGCLYGIMPANGLIYTPSHACACYPESKTYGFCAFGADVESAAAKGGRLEKGSAYGSASEVGSQVPDGAQWPTFRGDTGRNGATRTAVPARLSQKWSCRIGGKLSATTIADGKVFVAAVDAHTLHAIDAATGKPAWTFTAGARIDSPPTIHDGMAIFGCRDGYVYCLRASDGALAWRFRAAPADSRIMAFEQLESRWPGLGSVLVHNDVVHAIAGRNLFLDGGMRLVRLDATTGKLLGEELLTDRDPESGEGMQTHVKRLTMPVALPDVLSTDGKHLYMRSQVFDMNGKRREIAPVSAGLGAHASVQRGETEHLFASAGFLDDTWFHRSYWVYGRKFEGGWNAYYLAGKKAPAGKILCADDEQVYGFGREPKYFKWTVPMEFHLFAVGKGTPAKESTTASAGKGAVIDIDKTKCPDPAKSPLTVMAWVNSEARDGVVVAQGGAMQGYALYLKGSKPHFAVAANTKSARVSGRKAIPKGWVHLAGVLGGDKKMRLYVNGKSAGEGAAPDFITKLPDNGLQVGADYKSRVGDYDSDCRFNGTIDEVRIYGRDMPEEAVRAHAKAVRSTPADGEKLLLRFAFDSKGAADGRFGGGLQLESGGAAASVAGRYAWSRKVPVLVRGMCVAGETLFFAGPEDIVDEPQALKAMDEKATEEAVRKQELAFAGKAGGILQAVGCADGATRCDIRIDTTPVWDGLSAANGYLFLSATDGTLRCFGE